MNKLMSGDADIDFIGRFNVFAVISGLLVAISIVLVATVGLNFGIDFAGGYEIQAKFPAEVTDTKLKEIIAPLGLGDARVQRFGDAAHNEFLIMIPKHGTLTDAAKADLEADFVVLAGGKDKLTAWVVAESGERVTVGFANAVDEKHVTETFTKRGMEVKNISRGEREDKPEYTVILVSLADRIRTALIGGLGLDNEANPIQRVEFVGPQVGEQLRSQGTMAILWALFFILLYVAIRFDLSFAPGAIVALAHDVVITVGAFSLLQLEFNLPIIAAVLAIVGYSLNDTIVIYDRIRENTIRLRGRPLRALVNTSINQTLSRTLLTSGTTLMVVVALLVFGGGIIRDFSVALLIGIAVGTYSSVAIASPVYILLRERQSRMEARTQRTVAAAPHS
ncbi:MAG: protein translocase subunit SecF [Myxococcota bacterium]